MVLTATQWTSDPMSHLKMHQVKGCDCWYIWWTHPSPNCSNKKLGRWTTSKPKKQNFKYLKKRPIFTKFYWILRNFTHFCGLGIFEFFQEKKCVDTVHVIFVGCNSRMCDVVGWLTWKHINTHCIAHTWQHHLVQTLMDCTSQILCISYLELVVKPDTTPTIIKTFLLSSLEHVHTVVTHITICNTQDIGLCHCFLFVGKPVWWSPPTPPTSLYTSTAHLPSQPTVPPLPPPRELRHPRFQPLGTRCTTTSTQSPAHHTHTYTRNHIPLHIHCTLALSTRGHPPKVNCDTLCFNV